MTNKTQIKCPSCGTSVDVQDILAHPVQALELPQGDLRDEKEPLDE